MRGRSVVIVAVLLSAWTPAGCDGSGAVATSGESRPQLQAAAPTASAEASASGQPSASPSPSPSRSPARSVTPAAAAGGPCRQLTYEAVAAAVGIRFEVAAASGTTGHEQVCVLQRVGKSAPDLTFSVTPTTTDVESFRLDFQPKDGTVLARLGQAAYTQISAGGLGSGPQAEVGWLDKKAVYTLTFTTATGAGVAVAQKAVPGLATLAKTLSR